MVKFIGGRNINLNNVQLTFDDGLLVTDLFRSKGVVKNEY